MSGLSDRLNSIAEQVRRVLTAKDEAREKVLPLCRGAIRHCSETIRAVHRQEFEPARELLQQARRRLDEAEQTTAPYHELRHSGYVLDAQKEFAEASITLALVTGQPLPTPTDLRVEVSAYLNGLGEAVGELRRYILDALRRGDAGRGEEILQLMDDIYVVLVTMDFPDALTANLRRTTDVTRSIIEKTRGDLTYALQQRQLEESLRSFEIKILERQT